MRRPYSSSHPLCGGCLTPTDKAPTADGVRWQDVFPDYVAGIYQNERLWDGVFIDNALDGISWIDKNIDINHDGTADAPEEADRAWREGIVTIIRRIRDRLGDDAVIVTNSSSLGGDYTNGRLFESALSDASEWNEEFKKFREVSQKHTHAPHYFFINANTRNTGDRSDLKNFRFAYVTSLLTGAYFSFDHGDQWHQQLWWYDEYAAELGKSLGNAYEIQGKDGVWRRDFERGIVLANASGSAQNIDLDGEFITQSGKHISHYALEPHDGAVLKR